MNYINRAVPPRVIINNPVVKARCVIAGSQNIYNVRARRYCSWRLNGENPVLLIRDHDFTRHRYTRFVRKVIVIRFFPPHIQTGWIRQAGTLSFTTRPSSGNVSIDVSVNLLLVPVSPRAMEKTIEHCYAIKFCAKLNKSLADTHQIIQEPCVDSAFL